MKLTIPYTASDEEQYAFVYAGSVLIIILGLFTIPIIYLLGGGLLVSFVFLIVSGVVFFMFILYKGILFPGFASALPILIFFRIQFPVLTLDTNVVLYILISDIISIPLGIVGLIAISRDIFNKSAKLITIVLILFVTWVLISGILAIFQGFPYNGLAFGFEQTRYIFILSTTFLIVSYFGGNSVIKLLIISASYQVIISALQSIFGVQFTGLGYFGDVSYGFSDTIHFFGVTLNTGLFPGGFVGSSRGLLAMLIILFPISFYYLYQYSWIPAYVSFIGTPLVALFAATSEAGFGAILLMIILSFLLLKFKHFIIKNLTKLQFTIVGVISVITGVILALAILKFDYFSAARIRWDQYVSATKLFFEYPIFGIGVENFNHFEKAVDVSDVHNIYLAYLSGAGLPSLLLFLWANIVVYIAFMNNLFTQSNRTELVLLYIGIIGFLSFSFFDKVFEKAPVMIIFWMIVAIIIIKAENN